MTTSSPSSRASASPNTMPAVVPYPGGLTDQNREHAVLNRCMVKASRLRALHRTRNLMYDNYERLYYKHHWETPPLDESDYQVTLPIHTIVVNTAHAIITGMPISLRAYPNRPDSDRDIARADDVERWHLGIDAENTRSNQQDEWEMAAFNQALFGVGVLREVYAFPEGWASGRVQMDDLPRYPIIQHSLDPRQVYWEDGNPPRGRHRTIFYDMELTVEDILAVFGTRIQIVPRIDDKGSYTPLDYDERRVLVDWWEWQGDTLMHGIFCEVLDRKDGELPGQWIKPLTAMPEYWGIPYQIFPFFATNSPHPQDWGLSVLYALTDIPHWMEILASRQMRAMELYVDPLIKAQRGPNGSNAPIEIDKSPGSIIDLQPGDSVEYLQWAGSPPDVQRLWNTLDEIIHELSFSKTLMAQGSADATGFRTALDRETSILKISKGLQNFEHARERVYAARAFAVGKFSADSRIPVWGEQGDEHFAVALPGKTISQYRSLKVEVKPRFAGDLMRDINTAVQAVTGKLWSIDDAMDFVPPPNNRSKQATRQAIIADTLEFHPEVLGARARQMAAQIDLETQELMSNAQGTVGSGVTPGSPPMMPPGAPGPGSQAGGDMVQQILKSAQKPGPSGGAPGLPGSGGGPGQPAGANPASPFTAGQNNQLRPNLTGGASAGGGSPSALGTAQPSSIIEQILKGGQGK